MAMEKYGIGGNRVSGPYGILLLKFVEALTLVYGLKQLRAYQIN
jgi:hypothetical protein